ncbi:MAG: hypothetical protein JWO36_1363 [Myxococcales bacterium]|nr:hypothetical protein [Myxococcales bacterium]
MRGVVLGILLAACYAPDPQSGIPCAPGNLCPEGQRCRTGVCQPDGTVIDDAQKLADGQATQDSGLADARADATACSFAGLTCAGSIGSTRCNSLCFVFCSDGVTEPSAEARCQAWGGHLASILSQADEDCLNNAHPDAAWIGHVQASVLLSPAAGWSWIAGQPVTYTNWSTGQPDDGDGIENGAEQCAYKSTTNVWLDAPCTTVNGFACR